MIARIWRGIVRLEDADEYAAYIRDTGFTGYAQTSGNRDAWMLRRDAGDRTELAGLTGAGSQLFTQDSPGVPDQAEVDDNLGFSVALADSDGDADADLAADS